MSFSHLLQRYDAIGVYTPRMDITIDQAFTGSAELTVMFQAAFGQDAITIRCTAYDRPEGGEHLALAGTATLLGIDNANVAFRADDKDGALRVTLGIDLPAGWSFAQSFPDLPDEYDPGELDEEQRFKPSFLGGLSLGACKLVFSSLAEHSDRYGADLLPGLNFAGEVYFLGTLAGLRTLTGKEGPFPLTGPVREFRLRPDPLDFLGLRLRAPLALSGGDTPIPLRNASLYVKSPVDIGQVDHTVGVTRDPGVYLFAEVEVAGRPLEVIARFTGQGESTTLTLYGFAKDFGLAGFSSLAQTVGGDDVAGGMPPALRAPEGLTLTELGLTVDFAAPAIRSVMVGAGCKTRWALVPDQIVLEEIGVNVRVADPFGKGRALSVTLSGEVAVGDVRLAAFAELPSLRFGGGLPEGATIPAGKLIERYAGSAPDLPEMVIDRLLFDADPGDKSFSMACGVRDALSIPVGETSFDVVGLGLALDYGGRRLTGAFTGDMAIGGATAVIGGELTDQLTLSGSLRRLDLRPFWSQVTGEALPDEVPDILLDTLTVTTTPKTGAFSLLGSATIDWDGLTGGAPMKTSVQFSFSRDAKAIRAGLTLQGTGDVSIARGFDLKAFNLLFDYRGGAGWSLSGGATVSVLDKELALQAGYETAGASRKIKLQAIASPAVKLVELDGVGDYRFSQLDLMVERRTVDGGKAQTFFDLRVGSTLTIAELGAIGGFLCLGKSADGAAGLVFKPAPGSADLSIHFPAGEGVGVGVSLVEIGLVKESAAAGWAFAGTAYIGFTGLSSGLAAALPSRALARLVAGKGVARLSLLNPTDPIEVTLPSVNGTKLGAAVLQLTDVGVAIRPELGLAVEAGVGIPAGLNELLGGREVFRVYQEGDVRSLTRTRFTIAGTGIAMQFLSSPFAGANAVVVDGDSWFDVDFGQYGAIRLKLPTFIYDGVTQYFEAAGGFQITRPLALPLTPLKALLEAGGLKSIADMFPDKVPVTRLSLVDKNNNLKVDDLIAFIKQAGGVPAEVTSALKKVGKLLNRFPDGFKSYFNIEVPGELQFKFGYSPAGRVSLGLLAPRKPIRVLFPSVVQSYVPMPGLTGIELSKLTIGTLAAGSLFYSEIDAVIDQFDLPSLALSLLLPTDEDFPLPTSDQMQRRVILDNVFCIVPVSQGAPVPIPVFYDQIGFEYLGIEGLGLQTHLSFPRPALDGGAVADLVSTLQKFTTDAAYLLDPKRPPGGVDLAFTFRDEYLQAPEYLGGGILGTRGKDIRVSLWKYVATLMNYFKRFSINDLVGAIPIEHRAGSAEYRFAFLKFDADWLLTTPAEFKGGAFERLKLTAGDRDDFLTVLPSVASSGGQQVKGGEEGLVTFLRGAADLGFVRLDAAFGLAASGSMGFNTGFKLGGAIGQVLALELRGAVMVNAPLATGTTQAQKTQAAQPTAASAPAKPRALSLNGKDAWVQLPASDSLLLAEYTVEMWLRPAAGQVGTWLEVFGVDTQQGGAQRNFYLELNGPNAFYGHHFKDGKGGNSGPPNTPKGSVRWGQWQHVAITNDGVTARTFIDGKEVSSAAVSGKLVQLKDAVFIGKAPNKDERFLRGELCHVRIWKRARSAAEIRARLRDVLRGDEKDLVSLYRFTGDTGDRAVDECGRNHGTIVRGSFVASSLMSRGTWTGTTRPTDDAAGKLRHDGLIFDGAGDYAAIPRSDAFKTGAYTVEAWVRPDKDVPGTWQCVWGASGNGPKLYINSNGLVSHRYAALGTKASFDLSGVKKRIEAKTLNTAAGQVRWGEWNHLAITNDGKTARICVNGVVQAESSNALGKLVTEAAAVNIGRSDDGTNRFFFRGSIDDLRVWSVARKPDQLRSGMDAPLTGKEAGIVAWYDMDHTAGQSLADSGPRKLHGTITGADWALAAAPEEPARAALQVQGHAHLAVAGHEALVADLRLVDGQFWFAGQLDLFPSDWPIRVRGRVEGLISKERFYLSGDTENELFGLVLSRSRVYLSNDQMRLEGRWLGAYALLDISWDKNEPRFAGAIGLDASPALDFGAIRINGVKVADNVRITVSIHAGVSVVVSKKGFSADVAARFKINGKGFDLGFHVDIAPADADDLMRWIGQKIVDAPTKYLSHLFSDAEAWVKNVAQGGIEFAKDSAEAVGAALKSGYGVAKENVASLMRGAGYASDKTSRALQSAYQSSADEAARLLKGAGYGVDEVCTALRDTYRAGYKETVRYLNQAGYEVKDLSRSVSRAYNKSAEDIGRALKDAGYTCREISDVMKNVYGKSAKEAAKYLTEALGYGKNEVKGVLKAVGYASKEVDKAYNWAKENLNPANWF